MTETVENIESVGPSFTREGMLETRNRTWEGIEAIAKRMQPGMTEAEGIRAARKALKGIGLLPGWHKVCVRFGCNTILEYGAPSKPGVCLQENDILTIDIGPLWKGWEGDGGNTYVLGTDPEMHRAKRDVVVLWNRVRNEWRDKGLTGCDLYDYAAVQADKMGWVFNPAMAGHRVGDFPHRHRGRLNVVEKTPQSHLWILEILIHHKTRAFGAYYEDLLVPD